MILLKSLDLALSENKQKARADRNFETEMAISKKCNSPNEFTVNGAGNSVSEIHLMPLDHIATVLLSLPQQCNTITPLEAISPFGRHKSLVTRLGALDVWFKSFASHKYIESIN